MFCKNCGNQVAEGTAFCGVCGAKIAENAPVAESVQPAAEPDVSSYEEAAPQDTAQYEAAAPEDTSDYEAASPTNEPAVPTYINDGAVNEPAPKKKSKKWLFIGIPVLAVILVVVLCFNTFTGMLLKTFASDASYFAYVEGTSLEGYGNVATSLYGMGKNNIVNGGGSKGEIVIELGDTLTTMLSGYANGMDLSWLKQIKLVIDADTAQNKSSATAALVLGDQTILNLECIMDTEKGAIYLKCKELNDKFIKFEVPDFAGSGMTSMSVSANSSNAVLNNISTIMEYLPTEEELDKLLEKYVAIVLKQITDDDVTKESGEITANGITESCTVLKLSITDRLLLNVVKAVLTEAENDKEIIAVIEKLEKGIKEISKVEGNAVDEYKEGVADALEEIGNTLADLEGNGTEYLVLTDYVNGAHEIIGREIGANSITAISILSAESGNDIGYEVSIADKLSVKGKGTENGDAVTGDFTLSVEGKEIVTLGLENFSSDLENCTLNGAVVLKFGKDVKDLMDSSAYTTLSLLNPSLRMEFDTSKDKSSSSIAVFSGESVFVKLSANSEATEAKVANAPSDSETVSYTEIDISELDLSKLVDNLKKAGVPENLLTVLQYATMIG